MTSDVEPEPAATTLKLFFCANGMASSRQGKYQQLRLVVVADKPNGVPLFGDPD